MRHILAVAVLGASLAAAAPAALASEDNNNQIPGVEFTQTEVAVTADSGTTAGAVDQAPQGPYAAARQENMEH